jgi:WD40 repeat protein
MFEMNEQKRKSLDEVLDEAERFESHLELVITGKGGESARARFVARITYWLADCAKQGRFIPPASAERRALKSLLEYWSSRLRQQGLHEGIGSLADFDPSAGIVLTGDCPYPGLEPYTESRRSSFFGREAAVASYVAHLEQQGNRILLIIGASGSGKSSLALAGILPRLKELHDGARLFGARLTPGAHPGAELAGSVAQAIGRPELASEIERGLGAKPGEALDQLAELCQDKPLMLFVDQFEELLTLCRDAGEQHAFSEALCALSDPTASTGEFSCRILLTLRTDHLARFEDNNALKPLHTRLVGEDNSRYLSAVGFGDIKRAIKDPAEKVGLRFIPAALIDRLASQTAGLSNGLPLLQFALRRLWDTRPTNESGEPLDLIAEEMVNALPDVERALGTVADDIFRGFSTLQQLICERLLLELVVLDESFEEPLRRRRNEAELRTVLRARFQAAGDLERVISDFVGAGLLRRFGEGSDCQLEVAHEALLRHWDHIYRLVTGAEVKERLHLIKQIGREASDWASRSRMDDYLNLRGERLHRAVTYAEDGWLAEAGLAAYIEACRSQEVAEGLKEERAKQADRSKLRADLEAKNARKFRNISLVLSVAILGLFATILIALVERNSAKENEKKAVASEKKALANEKRAGESEKKALANEKRAGESENRALANEKRAGESENRALANEQKAKRQARISSLRNMVATSITNLDIDPQLSILLALTAANQAGTEKFLADEAADALSRAISVSRIERFLPAVVDAKDAQLGVAYDHDGTRLATFGERNVVKIWDANTGQLLRSLEGNNESISTVVFATKGNLLFTTKSDKATKIWDAESEKKPLPSLPLGDDVSVSTFSADGKLLATAQPDGSLKLWDASTGNSIKGLKESNQENVQALSFSPNGRYLATGSADGTVAVWTVSTGEERYKRPGHNDQVICVRFSPDGKLLATASMDNTAKIWDADKGIELHTLGGHTNTVLDVAFSPNSERIVTASADCTARLYDTESGRHLATLAGDRLPIESVAFSPDEMHVATASWDGRVSIWNVGGLTDEIDSVAFSEDGRKLATASPNGTALVWDAETGEPLVYKSIHHAITSIALSPKGDRIAIGSNNGELMISDAIKLKHELSNHHGPVFYVEFSRDGNRLVSASNQKAFLWDFAIGDRPVLEMASDYYPHSLALSPEGARVAIGDYSGMINVWDSTTKDHREFSGHAKPVGALAFSSNGELLASGSDDGVVRLWDVATGEKIGEPMDQGAYVAEVRFSPNGERLVTTGLTGTVKLWDVASPGKPPLTLTGHFGAVEKTAFSSDGTRLATGSWDRTARVWDVASGKQLLVLTHSREVKDVAFSTDGTRLTTVSADGKIRVHFFDGEKLRKFARAHIHRDLTPEECIACLEQDSSP